MTRIYRMLGIIAPKNVLAICSMLFLNALINAQSSEPINELPEYEIAVKRLINQGHTFRNSNLDSAHFYYQKALLWSRKNHFADGIFQSYYHLAICEINRAEFDTAKVYLNKAAPMAGKSKSSQHLITGIYGNLATISAFQGDYKKAAKYLDSSIYEGQRLKLDDKQRFLASVYNNLGAVYIRLHQTDIAQDYLSKSASICRRDSLFVLLPNTLINQVELYSAMGAYEKAFERYNEGIALSKKYNLNEQSVALHLAVAEMFLKQKKPLQSMQYLSRNMPLDEYPYYKVMHGYLKGKVLMAMKKYANAETNLVAALNMASEKKITDNRIEMHQALSSVYQHLGNYKMALDHQIIHQKLNDSILSRDNLRDVTELEMKYRVLEKDRELALKEAGILKAQTENQKKTTAIWVISLGLLLLLSIIFFIRYRQISKLKRLTQQQQLDVLNATMEGEEAERARVGQELHDGVSGFLSAIKLNLVTLRVKRKDIAQEPNFVTTIKLADEAADELRKTAHNLIPANLIDNGIGNAINYFCERVVDVSDLKIEVFELGTPRRLTSAMELAIYRSLQELIHNIIKHAAAQQAIVSLSWQGKLLLVTVEDDGKGLTDTEARGFGLKSIQKRVGALKGTMEICSAQEEGTSVYLEFPLLK